MKENRGRKKKYVKSTMKGFLMDTNLLLEVKIFCEITEITFSDFMVDATEKKLREKLK